MNLETKNIVFDTIKISLALHRYFIINKNSPRYNDVTSNITEVPVLDKEIISPILPFNLSCNINIQDWGDEFEILTSNNFIVKNSSKRHLYKVIHPIDYIAQENYLLLCTVY